ncbi:MAG: hypothetical protein NTZ04_02485 [Chloroflexi bacterium]|nr:hypothetical protein [Chloroflexota bacterium]
MRTEHLKLSRQEILNAHSEWYSGLQANLRQLERRVSTKIQLIRENQEYTMDDDESLANMFFMHLDEYVSRAREVGPLGVGGTEPDVSLPPMQDALIDTIPRLWNDASMAYIHGHFRGCIFLSATMLEGALRLKIKDKRLERELKKRFEKPMLGNLIRFLKDDNRRLVTSKVIELSNVVNDLRVQHIHLLVEEEPQDLLSISPRDEFVPLAEFRGSPPIRIKRGYISGDGVDLKKGTAGILYKYKKDAKESIEKSREILRSLYPQDDSSKRFCP